MEDSKPEIVLNITSGNQSQEEIVVGAEPIQTFFKDRDAQYNHHRETLLYSDYNHRQTYSVLIDDQSYGLTTQQRRKYIRRHVFYSLFELMIVILACFILYYYANWQLDFINRNDIDS